MKKTLMIASSAALVVSLAACKQEAEAPKAAESPAAASGSMTDMPMAKAMKHGKATGTVTEIDAAKGMVMLDHSAIPELQWPAMKMGFAAAPGLLAGIRVGDKVDFELDWDGQAGTITKIEKSSK